MDTVGVVIAKDTGAEPNPDHGTVAALRAVLLYTLTDTFRLVPDESLWLRYELSEILAPLEGHETSIVPLAVRQEMLGGTASAALARLHAHTGDQGLVWDPSAIQATAEQWTTVIMAMIKTCYDVPAMVEMGVQARIVAALRDLGLDDPDNPRPSRYLPNDVRFSLNKSM